MLSYDKNLIFIPSTDTGVVEVLSSSNLSVSNEIRTVSKSKKGMIMCIKQIDFNLVLCGYENGELVAFDNYTEKANIDLFRGEPVLSFDFSASKKIGIAGSSGAELKQFSFKNINNIFTFELTGAIQMANPGVNCIKIRQSDSLIFSCGCWDSRIRIISLKKLRLLAVLDFHKEAINSLDFCQQNTLVSGSSDGFITLWDVYN